MSHNTAPVLGWRGPGLSHGVQRVLPRLLYRRVKWQDFRLCLAYLVQLFPQNILSAQRSTTSRKSEVSKNRVTFSYSWKSQASGIPFM